MLVASATRTSLAVQFSASDDAVDPAAAPFAMLYSFCKQVCADAGAASVSVPSKLKAKAVHQHRKSFLPFQKLINSPPTFPTAPLDRAGRPPGLTRRQSFLAEFETLSGPRSVGAAFKPVLRFISLQNHTR